MAIIKGKPQPFRIETDDCAYVIGDDTYLPHIGEWVEMLPGMTIGEYRLISTMGDLGARMDAAKGDPDEEEQIGALIRERHDLLLESLSGRVVDWNWTDINGKPLPKPDGTDRPLRRLHAGELYYLLRLAEGESPAVEKKGSSDSRTTSSATTRPRTRAANGTVRNRTKGS